MRLAFLKHCPSLPINPPPTALVELPHQPSIEQVLAGKKFAKTASSEPAASAAVAKRPHLAADRPRSAASPTAPLPSAAEIVDGVTEEEQEATRQRRVRVAQLDDAALKVLVTEHMAYLKVERGSVGG